MRKEETFDDFSAPEIFVDGFVNHASRDGVMSCVGYRSIGGRKIIVLRLVWPAANTTSAVEDAMSALNHDIEIGSKRAH